MSQPGVSKDVQAELMKKRTRRRDTVKAENGVERKPLDLSAHNQGIPYPVHYSPDLFLYDNWNFIFMGGLVRNITVHRFETLPTKVLDLGCGNGLWVVEAAKQWQDTKFVGFDIQKCQPDLTRPELELTEIAERVEWVHGDLLETLPFEAETFDFVRVCGLGLAVPEDEWQDLFEECARILVPGGLIEMVEDDLIFPSTRLPKKDESSPGEPSSAKSSFSTPSAPASSKYDTSQSSLGYVSVPSNNSSEHQLMPPPLLLEKSSSTDTSSSKVSASHDPEQQPVDPRDHTKLIQSWDNMLHRRFITPNILSVLPFYLSAYFHDIQLMPTLHILLPPSSQQLSSDDPLSVHRQFVETPTNLAELYLDLRTHGTRWSTDHPEGNSLRSRQPSRSATITSWASIHLARGVETVRSCRSAMWEEFRNGKGFGEKPEVDEVILREDFDLAWTNWENDMKDRMSMRAKLYESLAWLESGSNDRPDWKVWRERAGEMEISDAASTSSSYIGPENLCRSMRAFVGVKPKES